jgi:hypothetical protein
MLRSYHSGGSKVKLKFFGKLPMRDTRGGFRMTEVWINVYEKEDGSLKPDHWVHATRAEADQNVIEGRVACIRIPLERRFDSPPIPQEVGALIGKRVSYQFRNTSLEKEGIIMGDYRLDPRNLAQRYYLFLSDCDGQLRHISIGEIKSILT